MAVLTGADPGMSALMDTKTQAVTWWKSGKSAAAALFGPLVKNTIDNKTVSAPTGMSIGTASSEINRDYRNVRHSSACLPDLSSTARWLQPRHRVANNRQCAAAAHGRAVQGCYCRQRENHQALQNAVEHFDHLHLLAGQPDLLRRLRRNLSILH